MRQYREFARARSRYGSLGRFKHTRQVWQRTTGQHRSDAVFKHGTGPQDQRGIAYDQRGTASWSARNSIQSSQDYSPLVEYQWHVSECGSGNRDDSWAAKPSGNNGDGGTWAGDQYSICTKPQVWGHKKFVLNSKDKQEDEQSSEEIKRPSKKPSMAWKKCVLNISNSVIWDQIGKEVVEEWTSGIAGRYGNQPHVQLTLLNKEKIESGEYSIPRLPPTSGGLQHVYDIFKSKFMKYFGEIFLPLVTILTIQSIFQDSRKSKQVHRARLHQESTQDIIQYKKRKEKSHLRY